MNQAQLELPCLTPGATRESTLERVKELCQAAGSVKIRDIMAGVPCSYETAGSLVDDLIAQGFCEAIYHPGYRHGGRRILQVGEEVPAEN